MRLRPFVYHAAGTLPEALEILDRYGAEVKVLAGGTDLILAMKEKRLLPERVLSIFDVAELDYVLGDNGRVRIGALSKHSTVAASPLLRERASALAEAAGLIGSWQIRNVGTIGGNLCNASPAADSAAPLLVYDAQAVLVGPEGESRLPLVSLFTGPGSTALGPRQLLKEITFELPVGRAASCYYKLMRKKAVDLSLVGVAILAELDQSGQSLARVAVGLGGVAPTPIRANRAEELLNGLSLDQAQQRISQAAQEAMAAAKPISDVRASADYKRDMVEVLTRRGIEKVFKALAG